MHARLSFAVAGALAALATLPATGAAQGSFEGVVTFQMSMGPSGGQSMQYSIKNGKARWDISTPGGNMFMLVTEGGKTMDMVIPERRMYMERSMGDMAAKADSAGAKAKINWTGKKETIAGYECEHATVTDADGSATDLCLAKGLGVFVGMGGAQGGRGGMGMGGDWQGHLGEAFPLKVEHGGQVVMQATKVEKQSLDDSIFQVPDGYQKMTMPMGGRGGE
jgi:hypothetical protein